MYTLSKETKDQLFSLLTSTDFDIKRIVIADHEIDSDCITIYLEDKLDFKNSIDECLELKISLKEFATFIEQQKHNYYQGQSVNSSGNFDVFTDWIKINDPIAFYNEDATSFHQQSIREELVEEILKTTLASVTHG